MKAPSIISLSVLIVSLAASAAGQSFGPQQVLTTDAMWAMSVYATDLDEDGDADVLSCSNADDKVSWFENLGGGAFGPQQVISTAADGPSSIHATDLDGDGDADVLSASYWDNKIAWYENLGGGTFGAQQVITQAAAGARTVYAADLDGDGDADVLSASSSDNTIAWYENLGAGAFGSQQVITTAAVAAWSVHATDLDGDGDVDVLSTSYKDDKIAWYENLGAGTFGPQRVISTTAEQPLSVYATDLDGDGDADVLSAARGQPLVTISKISWYENLGSGVFGPEQVITTQVDGACCVYATDLDGDGDADVLSASTWDSKIAWYENLGAGAFGPQQVISGVAFGARGVHAADLDGDGDADVLSASEVDNKVAWYENLMDPCLPTNYCTAQTNSSGGPAEIGFRGTTSLGARDLVLTVQGAPSGTIGFFFYAGRQGLAPFGRGNHCVAPPYYVLGPLLTIDASGSAMLPLDFASPPLRSGPGQVSAFETWNFQFWFRDPHAGAASFNTSDALAVTFCP